MLALAIDASTHSTSATLLRSATNDREFSIVARAATSVVMSTAGRPSLAWKEKNAGPSTGQQVAAPPTASLLLSKNAAQPPAVLGATWFDLSASGGGRQDAGSATSIAAVASGSDIGSASSSSSSSASLVKPSPANSPGVVETLAKGVKTFPVRCETPAEALLWLIKLDKAILRQKALDESN